MIKAVATVVNKFNASCLAWRKSLPSWAPCQTVKYMGKNGVQHATNILHCIERDISRVHRMTCIVNHTMSDHVLVVVNERTIA